MQLENKSILNYFDFDDTLFYIRRFQRKYNEHLKYLEYDEMIRQLESFWIKETFNQLKYSQTNDDAITVMCTARVNSEANKKFLLTLFDISGIKFDYIFLRDPSKNIPLYKADVVEYMVKHHPSIKQVNVWEDCEKNILAIENKCKKLNVTFDFILV